MPITAATETAMVLATVVRRAPPDLQDLKGLRDPKGLPDRLVLKVL
jgi:hypothetical protein